MRRHSACITRRGASWPRAFRWKRSGQRTALWRRCETGLKESSMLKSTPDRYGVIPITIHWLTAILILALLGSGFQAGNALDSSAKAAFLRFHIPTAITIRSEERRVGRERVSWC